MSSIVKKGTGGGELTNIMSMRLSPEDGELLDAVAALVPVVPRLTLARIALRIGLEAIRQNPARALTPSGRRQAR
jgi:hypothetical protein